GSQAVDTQKGASCPAGFLEMTSGPTPIAATRCADQTDHKWQATGAVQPVGVAEGVRRVFLTWRVAYRAPATALKKAVVEPTPMACQASEPRERNMHGYSLA